MNKQDLIQKLSLVKHVEGSYFSETYRSCLTIDTAREGNQRNLITSIYYLLTKEQPIGYFNKNQSPILHYFHGGSPLTYLILSENGHLERVKLGFDVTKNQVPQLLVPENCWKATILESGEYGLLGEAVSPGFDYRDMSLATPDYFRSHFPQLWSELAPYVKS